MTTAEKKTWVLRLVAAILLGAASFTALAQTAEVSAAGQFNVRWARKAISSSASVSVPQDNWQLVGGSFLALCDDDRNGLADDEACKGKVEMLRGQQWITRANETSGMLGLESNQTADILERLPSNTPIILGRYLELSAQMRINVFRLVRLPSGVVNLYVADFTPHHGEYWRAARHYLTEAERLADSNAAGRNPFAGNRGGNTDPIFYRVDRNQAQIALGHAMAYFRSSIAYFVEQDARWNVEQSQSGGWLRRRYTTTWSGYSKPKWSIALPAEVARYGTQARRCLKTYTAAQCIGAGITTLPNGDPVTDGGCCLDAACVATSGIVLSEVTGGSVSAANAEQEELFYLESVTTRSYSVLGNALRYGWLIDPTVYVTGSTVFGGGGYALSPQNGFMGATAQPDAAAPVITDDRARAFVSNVAGSHMTVSPFSASQPAPWNGAVSTGGVNGVAALVRGGCDAALSKKECGAAAIAQQGFVPRSDAYSEERSSMQLRSQYDACVRKGLSGADLQKCAAPASVSW